MLAPVFDKIDPRAVPLPNGTKVTSCVDLVVGARVIPQGAVGQVIDTAGGDVRVRLADGAEVTFLRKDVVPTKLGQLRYAIRRDAAWSALRSCVVLETVVGSRAWGLHHAESDVDRRGVFVLPFDWTVSLAEPPSELISADGSDTYWEVEKAIRQAMRADPNTLETLFLPSARAEVRHGALAARGARTRSCRARSTDRSAAMRCRSSTRCASRCVWQHIAQRWSSGCAPIRT